MVRRLNATELLPLFGPDSDTVRRWSDPKVNPATLAADWAVRIADGSGSVYGLFSGENLIGLFMAAFGQDFHDGAMVGTECFWSIDPAYRESIQAFDLLDEFELECAERRCARAILGIRYDTCNARLHSLRRVYTGLGYEPFSESFCKTL